MWIKLKQSEPKWLQVNPSEPKGIQVKQNEPNQVNPSEPMWNPMNQSEPKWTQVNQSKLKWTQVNRSVSMWIQVNQSGPKCPSCSARFHCASPCSVTVCSECHYSWTNEYPNIFVGANYSQMNVRIYSVVKNVHEWISEYIRPYII